MIQTIATAYAKLVMEAALAEVQMVLGVVVGPEVVREVVREVALAQEVMAALKAAVALALEVAVDQAAAPAAAPATTMKPKKVQLAPAKHTTNAAGAPRVRRAVHPAAKYGAALRQTVTLSAGVWTDTTDAPTFFLVLAHPPTRRPQLRALAEGRGRRRLVPVGIAAKVVLQRVE